MDTRRPLIVVVDDDIGMSRALERLLGAAGFDARVFDSAEALGASGCARRADCLVLDLHLPGVGGAEYYASLPRPRPPAVLITAHDGPAAQRNADRIGAQGCLVKPFDGTAFLDMIRSALRSGGAR
jgi:FixJ family two-component response regulator